MTRINPAIDISHYEHEGYVVAYVRAGNLGEHRIVPPAGEDHAFTVTKWKRRIEISVSPTGRSVRVFIDGKEWKP